METPKSKEPARHAVEDAIIRRIDRQQTEDVTEMIIESDRLTASILELWAYRCVTQGKVVRV
jgi:hypothetical protein